MRNKAFKYKLNPTNEQEKIFAQWVGHTRFIWNQSLAANKAQYEIDKKFIFYNDLANKLPDMKKEHVWLKEVPSQALQQKLRDFDLALRRVWKSGFGFPKFKYKSDAAQSFRIPQQLKQIKPHKSYIILPKIGKVKWIKHRPLEGQLKSVTIKKENDQWWCICICELPEVAPTQEVKYEDCVGIDLGIKEFAVTSDGEVFKSEHNYRNHEKKLRRKQRKLSKKQKGSKNSEKARSALNKLHYKIKCKRMDFTHKISNQITNDYSLIGVENLNIKGMVKNRKLSKSIADQGWAMFIQQLEYKSLEKGGKTVKIDRFAPSTKTCSNCGCKQKMSLGNRIYQCESCGFVIDRDLNAAINIKEWAIEEFNTGGTPGIYACGDSSVGIGGMSPIRYGSLKQESFGPIGPEASGFSQK